MSVTVFTEALLPPTLDRGEILRYMGAREEDTALSALLDASLAEVLEKLCYKVCYCELPLTVTGDIADFGFAAVRSASLTKNLENCRRAVVFAATVGLAPDRCIARYGHTAPARALCHQAIGAERIEALCEGFVQRLAAHYAKEGATLRPRFSPGYGDLPLTLQREIFALLDPARRIGLTLGESCIMVPSKSVTALIGIRENTGVCYENH